MSDTVIKVENLSKSYLIGHQSSEKYLALRDVWAAQAKSIGKRLLHPFKSSAGGLITADEIEEFWALRDVSFDIKQGDRVGIIGRNGAGKSTLLKVLSRITEPTKGRIEIDGRVASLLEVGTGFHPELTGRENIFLNGAVLGMSRVEIKKKFDEIVDFAEVEKFLDTPVKRYSSGMYVRLAFAVAAHLEPEILVVDEVLAVGDAAFQKKCLGKMENAAKEGRTVLFVSHQMGSIAQLCNSAFLLDEGQIVKHGKVKETIDYYIGGLQEKSREENVAVKCSDKDMYISRVQSLSVNNDQQNNFAHDEPILLSITCKINKWISNTVLGFYLTNHRGTKLFTNNNDKWVALDTTKNEITSNVVVPGDFLAPGHYSLTVAITVQHVMTVDIIPDALGLTVFDAGTVFSAYEGYDYGCVFADCDWSIEY